MHDTFNEQFDGLLEKFSELLTRDTSTETIEKVKIWCIYNHIRKTMPPLASHWIQEHAEAKADIRDLFEEIKRLNTECHNKT